MTISSDSNYQAIAAAAASRIGASSPAITKAILGQWQCELGNADTYPPRRNNPGNVARGWASSLGYPFRVEMPNPQPSNPIVTFGSPQIGAACYADGIRHFSRYAAAVRAARAGDGEAYIRSVIGAGYGGSISCALSVYRGAGGAPSPGGTLASAPDGGGLLEEFLAKIGRQLNDPVRSEDVIPFVQFLQGKHIVPSGDPGNPAVQAVINVMNGLIGQPWSAVGPRFLSAAGAPIDPLGLGGVAQAIANIPAALGDVARNIVFLLAILALVGVGLYVVVTSDEPGVKLAE